MEEETLYNRINDADYNANYVDGQVFQHLDANKIVDITKEGINENYYDIQRIQRGTKSVGNAMALDGATLSRYIDETLQADDDKVPSAQQVKAYVDETFSVYSPPIRGVDYWTESDKEEVVDEAVELVSAEVKIEMATFDVVDGKLIVKGTKYSEQILEDYTFQLNDNKLEVISNE